MLISFSGPDGVGKTTQINYLMAHFRNLGFKCCSVYDISPDIRYHRKQDLVSYYEYFRSHDVIHTRFRMNSDANNKIINELENNSVIPNEKLAMLAAQQGYEDAREWFDTVIFPIQSEKKILIFDRYIWDEIAFKTFYGCSLTYMENLYSNIERPRLSLLCTANTLTIKKRNRNRQDGMTTLYKSTKYIQQLNDIFANLSTTHKLQPVNMEKAPEATYKQIVNLINPILSIKGCDIKMNQL